MVAYLSKTILIGNVCKDPDMRFLPSGSPMTTFSVAVNHKFMKDGAPVSESEFFDIVTYNKLAENCNKFIAKGMPVYVEGRQHTRKWTALDGKEVRRVETIANSVLSLAQKPVTNGNGNNEDEPVPEDLPL